MKQIIIIDPSSLESAASPLDQLSHLCSHDTRRCHPLTPTHARVGLTVNRLLGYSSSIYLKGKKTVIQKSHWFCCVSKWTHIDKERRKERLFSIVGLILLITKTYSLCASHCYKEKDHPCSSSLYHSSPSCFLYSSLLCLSLHGSVR